MSFPSEVEISCRRCETIFQAPISAVRVAVQCPNCTTLNNAQMPVIQVTGVRREAAISTKKQEIASLPEEGRNNQNIEDLEECNLEAKQKEITEENKIETTNNDAAPQSNQYHQTTKNILFNRITPNILKLKQKKDYIYDNIENITNPLRIYVSEKYNSLQERDRIDTKQNKKQLPINIKSKFFLYLMFFASAFIIGFASFIPIYGMISSDEADFTANPSIAQPNTTDPKAVECCEQESPEYPESTPKEKNIFGTEAAKNLIR